MMPAIRHNQIVIVTGLPRSGTSMMMKMLEAGGVPPLCDGRRTADDDNPNGYYEFEPVKQTGKNAGWLQLAGGKAVKMVYSLLYDLPTDRRYDVIFMRRDLNEILASQSRMLQNMKLKSDVDDDRMARLFRGEIVRFQKWVDTANHIRCVEVLYNDVASGNESPLHLINAHLGGGLDTSAMSAIVDPSLYRNRSADSAA
ncbi:MAG: sulfotransferase family protein [Fuerstiella sp.]